MNEPKYKAGDVVAEIRCDCGHELEVENSVQVGSKSQYDARASYIQYIAVNTQLLLTRKMIESTATQKSAIDPDGPPSAARRVPVSTSCCIR
jgi:hypothetical protein